MALEKSVLYNFLSEKNGLSAHFLEGQEIIQSIATISQTNASGLSYLRDLILSTQPLTSFLANNEGFGLYIDSEDPYFRFKIESNQSGKFRTLLLPSELKELPETLNGVCRITKVFPNNKAPYTSVIELNNSKFSDVMSGILKNSYQIEGSTYLSDTSDQSLMLVKIPPRHLNIQNLEDHLNHQDFWSQNKEAFTNFFAKASQNEQEIIEFYESIGLKFLGKKEISFYCPCSREKMINGLISLLKTSEEDLFQGKDSLETKCDYCQTYYLIEKKELENLTKI